jgi:adenylate cyclase
VADGGQRFWQGLEGRFRPFGTAAVLEDTRIAARLPLLAGIGASLSIIWMATFSFLSGEPAAGWVAIVTGAAYASSTAYYYASGRAELAVQVILWASVANNVANHLVMGGFAWSGMSLGWGVLVTTAAALFLGRRSTVFIGATYLTAAIVLAFFEAPLRATRSAPAPEVSMLFALNMFVVSLVLLIPMTTLLIEQIAREQARANSLLLKAFPEVVAERLKKSPGIIADEFEACTVLFADIVGFTRYSSEVSPERLVTS